MLDNKNKDIIAKYQDERIASSTYYICSCHFAGSTHIYFTKARGRKTGLGVGVTGHAHRYVLILPAKRVFPFFGFEATSCHCITHPTVHRFTRNMHAYVRERKISCFHFFSAGKKNCHRHVNGFGDLPIISLVCNRARRLKKIFSLQ